MIKVSMAARRKQQQLSKPQLVGNFNDWLKDTKAWLEKTKNNVPCPLVEDVNGLHRSSKSARPTPEERPYIIVESGKACKEVLLHEVLPDGKPVADRDSPKHWHSIHVLNTEFDTHDELRAHQALHLELGTASVTTTKAIQGDESPIFMNQIIDQSILWRDVIVTGELPNMATQHLAGAFNVAEGIVFTANIPDIPVDLGDRSDAENLEEDSDSEISDGH